MRLLFPSWYSLVFIAFHFAVGACDAAIVTYTSPGMFNGAVAGRTIVIEDFDSAASGTLIATGSAFGGITFDYNWSSGESLRINDLKNTNSGTNYLGASNGTGTPEDLLADVNNLTMVPTVSASAMGLFVITRDPALDGDLILSTNGGSVSLTTADRQGVLPDSSEVYFLGLVEDTGAALGPFSLTASIGAGAAQLGYRVDGITNAGVTTVPEANSLLALIALTSGYCVHRRRRH